MRHENGTTDEKELTKPPQTTEGYLPMQQHNREEVSNSFSLVRDVRERSQLFGEKIKIQEVHSE